MRPVTWIHAEGLSRSLGVEMWLASETFQVTGSFKFRAAYEVVSRVPQSLLLTASSGNFGQGLACACQLLGKRAVVVMPDSSARVKVEAVRSWGAQVDLIDVHKISRRDRVAEWARRHPEAYVASAYDDPLVIEGNATLGSEIARFELAFDAVLAPIGGGGLTAGLICGLRQAGSRAEVVAVEPERANDAARSLREGRIVSLEAEPDTLADGVRTLSVGRHNWEILKTGLAGVIEVSEEEMVAAVRRLFGEVNLKAEPTGALSVAGLIRDRSRWAGRRICCVVSGGNVDPALYARLIG